MEKYNLLIDSQVVSDGSAIISGNGLQSGTFSTTLGEYSEVVDSLVGANVVMIFREQTPLEIVTGIPAAGQVVFDSETGTITVNSGQTFTNGERLFVTFTSAGEQTSTEPVTVQQVKNWLRLEGFIDDSESLSTDFEDDDIIIADLITSARQRLEAWTGLSFIPKSYKIEFTNLAGYFNIPFGPVTEITSLKLAEGEDELEYTTTFNNKSLKTPCYENMVMEYDAGYVTLPKGLKDALLSEIAYRYEHRGEEMDDKGLCLAAMNKAAAFKEVDTWLA